MPGCKDVVTDGWNGYLVPPRDPARLAARIIDLLNDGDAAREMGRRSIALVRRDFELDHVVGQYAELYHQIARARLPPTRTKSKTTPAHAAARSFSVSGGAE